ncbi:DUF21 domain-containing protein [Puia sp. P3]|uniref:DUF21 domain-containing protein n=1 Tax=Puia sp. P3 TaxID=3423952 RepID=UPI003D66AC99
MVINIGFWGAFILKVVLVCFVIILFSEVMPKIWASQNNLQFAYYTSGIIELVHLLFSRISGWAVSRSEGLEKFFGRKQKGEQLRYQIDQSVKNESSEEEKISSTGSPNSEASPSGRSCAPASTSRASPTTSVSPS